MYYQQYPLSYGYNNMPYQQPIQEVKVIAGGIPDFTKIGSIPIEQPVVNNDSEKKTRKPRSPKKKESGDVVTVDTTPIVESSYISSYDETNTIIRQTVAQLDTLAGELKHDIDTMRNTKSIQKKYDYLNGMNANMASLLSTKINAIKEMNNSINKSNELDYRKSKDMQVIASQDQDKAIFDLYNAYVSMPGGDTSRFNQIAQNLLVTNTGVDVYDTISPVVTTNGEVVDPGYQKYLETMTPEQKLMRYESNPNVQQCVLWDSNTGAKRFAMIDFETNKEIPGVPVHGEVVMEDTTIDERNGIARNVHINETYPLIDINKNPQYNGY